MTVERNFFLDEIGKRFHKQRPRVPQEFNTTTYIERDGDKTFVDIYVRSRGCHHNYLGGCTMCDYWVSQDFDISQMADYGQKALNALNFAPSLLVFGPSGSVFDDWEVPPDVRKKFYRMLQSTNASLYSLFSQVETITEDKLVEVIEYLDPSKVSVEMGLETANPWKLKYCINKAIEIEQVIKTVELLKHYKLKSAVYILIGVPFLTVSEMVEDAVSSVMWAFDHGVEYCVIFPMHIKPWTTVYWLYEHGMFEPISLWALVEVLKRFTPALLGRIGICWHRPRPEQAHPLYEKPSIPPTTCPICYDRVLNLLDSYRFSSDRAKTIALIDEIDCECKDVWRQKLTTVSLAPLVERVRNIYTQMGIDILGPNWWKIHGKEALSSVLDNE